MKVNSVASLASFVELYLLTKFSVSETFRITAGINHLLDTLQNVSFLVKNLAGRLIKCTS